MGLLSGLLGAASETDGVRFSAETQGHFDVESELKLLDIQRTTLAACVCR
ncbi:MAG: hypothetical protein AB3X44_16830 [Leptothrix sp. (in: b-proteobacteria)]